MKIPLYILTTLFVLGLAFALPGTASASGGEDWSTPASVPIDPDLDKAKTALKEKNWDKAIEFLNKAEARDPKNAGIHNELGFAERNRGNLDAAFKEYEIALTLDPKHRGAHEYIGEAYLMAGNLPKAEEHLAILDKLCFFPCEEYKDLKAAVAKYKQQHPN